MERSRCAGVFPSIGTGNRPCPPTTIGGMDKVAKQLPDDSDPPISLADVARLYKTRLETVHRWWKKGVRGGRKLTVIRMGGRYYTTAKWLAEFAETTDHLPKKPIPVAEHRQTVRDQRKAVDAARRYLIREGLYDGPGKVLGPRRLRP